MREPICFSSDPSTSNYVIMTSDESRDADKLFRNEIKEKAEEECKTSSSSSASTSAESTTSTIQPPPSVSSPQPKANEHPANQAAQHFLSKSMIVPSVSTSAIGVQHPQTSQITRPMVSNLSDNTVKAPLDNIHLLSPSPTLNEKSPIAKTSLPPSVSSTRPPTTQINTPGITNKSNSYNMKTDEVYTMFKSVFDLIMHCGDDLHMKKKIIDLLQRSVNTNTGGRPEKITKNSKTARTTSVIGQQSPHGVSDRSRSVSNADEQ